MLIDPREIKELYDQILQDGVSKNDLTETHKKQLWKYANKENLEALKLYNDYCIFQPDTTLEDWENISVNYRNSLYAIIWLQQNEPKEAAKPPPEENLIVFETGVANKLNKALAGYFEGHESELKKALNGEQLKTRLLFPHNQNQFVEVFKRAKYNGLITSTKKEIKTWICLNFCYQSKNEVNDFNPETVWDVLTKQSKETSKGNRICQADWLPYIPLTKREQEKFEES